MRHLLEELRKELEEPSNTPPSKTETDSLEKIFSQLEFERKQVNKDVTDPLTHKPLINNWDLSHYDNPLLVSTPLSSPVRNAPLTKIVGEETNDDDKRSFDSASLRDEVLNHQADSQEGFHQRDAAAARVDENDDSSNINSDLNQDDRNSNREIKELEDLGSNLSEMLHVSRSTHSVETSNEPDANSVGSVSDDDF